MSTVHFCAIIYNNSLKNVPVSAKMYNNNCIG
jgi:hypothetical protein